MTLLELSEDVFLFVCQLNRQARTTVLPDFSATRDRVRELFSEFTRKAGSDARLARLAQRVELPLACFVDAMVAASSLPFARQWHLDRLAVQQRDAQADPGLPPLVEELRQAVRELRAAPQTPPARLQTAAERLAAHLDGLFFQRLEATLEDGGEDALECLAVFYTCLGLGYVGSFGAEPEKLEEYMQQMFTKLRHLVDADPTVQLCPQAYEHTDHRNFTLKPQRELEPVLVGFAFVALFVFAMYCVWYAGAVEVLKKALEAFIKRAG